MKKKILTLLFGCVMCMSLVAIGVYALTQVNLGIHGTLSFIAYDKQVYVEDITIKNFVEETTEGYKSTDKTYEDYHGVYLKNSNATVDLSGKVLQGETLEIDITMVNLKSSYLKTILSYKNLPADVLIRSTGLYMPQNTGLRVESGQSKILKIYISNLSTTLTALDLSTINLTVAFDELTTLIHEGERVEGEETLSYYYVEMGTLPGVADENGLATEEYLKWRYISADGTTKYTATTAPTTVKGTYILETDVQTLSMNNTQLRNDNIFFVGSQLLCVSYNNNYEYLGVNHSTSEYEAVLTENPNVYANDYAYSNVRKYINGQKVYKASTGSSTYTPLETSHYSDMLTDLCIDKGNDLIYNRIKKRTLENLYSDDMFVLPSGYGTMTVEKKAHYAQQNGYDMTEKDMFWVPCYSEVKNLLANGSSWNAYGASDIGTDWNPLTGGLGSSLHSYYTRTPTPSDWHDCVSVSNSGALSSLEISANNTGIRPCFNLI